MGIAPALVALIASIAIPATASAAKHFRAYASCGVARASTPTPSASRATTRSPSCAPSTRARVRYRLCFRKAGDRQHCHDRHTRKPGQLSRTRFDVDGAGKYKLAWFANGRAVDRDKLVVRERAVFSVGDSLGEGTKPYLPGALPGWKVSQSVSTSRFLPEGVSIVRNRGGLPAVIVFALGTNDDPHNVEPAFATRSSRCSRSPARPAASSSPTSSARRSAAPATPASTARWTTSPSTTDNLRVADWAGLVARNRGWLAGDGSHVNATGYQARRG